MNIRFSALASYKLELLLDFLEYKWSKSSRDKFLKILSSKINQIKSSPYSCPSSDIKTDVLKLVVTKQTSAFYIISGNTITIITLFDNRQNQLKLTEEIGKHFT